MWTRAELKNNAKNNLSGSYWKSVLAAFLLWIGVACSGRIAGWIEALIAGSSIIPSEIRGWFYGWPSGGYYGYGGNGFGGYYAYSWPSIFRGAAFVLAVGMGAAIVAMAVRIAVSFFLCAPLEVGAQRWFIVNRYQKNAPCGEMVHPFNKGYLNVVKGMFLRWLYTFLWSLLFIVPGIVKSYSYRLVPYILAESPEMDTREAFRLSMEMMDGNKWKTFVLDLSFLGWEILDCFTFGLLDLFYVSPYRAQTNMELYIRLRDQYLGK